MRGSKLDLIFKQPSGTSRGILKTKRSYYIHDTVSDAIGEASLIEGLSPDDPKLIESHIYSNFGRVDEMLLQSNPALRFAYETLEQWPHIVKSTFAQGMKPIKINGLIWMGTKDFMYQQIREKLDAGYRCIKMKIGAIDFDEELALLEYIRRQYPATDLQLRVDANGAFLPDDVLEKLKRLASLDIHSIEQPIAPYQDQEMKRLCELTPIPIALDEDLINRHMEDKSAYLAHVRPQYIILKPSLIGGTRSADEWIHAAESNDISWWATSALESDIGLCAIASWLSKKELPEHLYQGLGTGQLFTNNVPSPLYLKDGMISYDPYGKWNFDVLKQ